MVKWAKDMNMQTTEHKQLIKHLKKNPDLVS